jgi:hypothetical protein
MSDDGPDGELVRVAGAMNEAEAEIHPEPAPRGGHPLDAPPLPRVRRTRHARRRPARRDRPGGRPRRRTRRPLASRDHPRRTRPRDAARTGTCGIARPLAQVDSGVHADLSTRRRTPIDRRSRSSRASRRAGTSALARGAREGTSSMPTTWARRSAGTQARPVHADGRLPQWAGRAWRRSRSRASPRRGDSRRAPPPSRYWSALRPSVPALPARAARAVRRGLRPRRWDPDDRASDRGCAARRRGDVASDPLRQGVAGALHRRARQQPDATRVPLGRLRP